MANDHVMTLDKQLANLEVTVAQGFQEQRQRLDAIGGRLDEHGGRLGAIGGRLDDHGGRLGAIGGRLDEHGGLLKEHTRRFDRLDDRIFALDAKLDMFAESIRGDVTTIRELVTGFMDEMRRTTDSMRREHEADRRLTRLALFDQVTRIRTLEGGSSGSES